MGMHVGQIIFSKFKGKYEKIKIYIYIILKQSKKFIKDNLYKKIILIWQWKIKKIIKPSFVF